MMVIATGERLLAVGQNFWLSIWTDSTVAAKVHHSRLDNRSYIAWYLVLGSVSIMLQVRTPLLHPWPVPNVCFSLWSWRFQIVVSILKFIRLASAHNLRSGGQLFGRVPVMLDLLNAGCQAAAAGQGIHHSHAAAACKPVSRLLLHTP